MIAPQRVGSSSLPRRARGRAWGRVRPAYRRSVHHATRVAPSPAPRPSLWQLFLDDRRALRLKWGLLLLLLLVAALIDIPI